MKTNIIRLPNRTDRNGSILDYIIYYINLFESVLSS